MHFRRLLYSSSISMRRMLMIFVLLILFALIVFASLTVNFINQVNQRILDLNNTVADSYVQTIQNQYERYQLCMDMISLNQEIRKNIFRTDVRQQDMLVLGDSLEGTINSMTYLLYQDEIVYDHRLYTYLPGNGKFFFELDQMQDAKWFRSADKSVISPWYEHSNLTDSMHMSIIRPIHDFNGPDPSQYCYQTLTVDLSHFFYPTTMFFYDSKADIFVFSKQNELLYTSSKNEKWAPDQWADDLKHIAEKDRGNPDSFQGLDSGYRLIWRELDELDARILFLSYPSPVILQGNFSEYIIIFLSVLMLIFMLLLLLYFYKNFSRRMNLLIERIDSSTAEKMHQSVITGNDEIAKIDRHIVAMHRRILMLVQHEYTIKTQMAHARHEALLAYINPHFLYNTLNAISTMANLEDAPDTNQMLLALSDMFHYSSNISDKMVTLQDEVKNISDYFYIQSVRFHDSFRYQIDIDPALLSCQIPKLILQPVVENAFKHGFQTTGTGQQKEMVVSAKKEDANLVISVRDNGTGIAPELLQKLQKDLKSSAVNPKKQEGGRIGLQNVNARIKLLFGRQYGLTIDSTEKQFTRIDITVVYKNDSSIVPPVSEPSG